MNAYLTRVYFNIEMKKQKPQEVWLKAENFSEIETKLKEKLGSKFRKVELLQTIKKVK